MKNTSLKRENVFSDVISKNNFSQEQITKLNNFSAKKCEFKYIYQLLFI